MAQTVTRRVTEAPDHWVVTLARLGYATIGIVYLMIGTLATQAALGTGGAIADTRDVLVTIARQPFGRVLLGLTALGLSGYVLWRLIQACCDPERKGTDARGLLTRLGFAVSGVAYAALAQFIGLCSRSKWSKHRTKSPFLALLAMAGSNAAYKIISACSHAVS